MTKKRANGEGTIRRRKDARWEAAIMDGYRPDGKPKMKYFCGKTQKEVKDKLEYWKQEKSSGINITEKFTFLSWSDFWFENHKENITATTQENYKYTLRILQGYFGSRTLSDIKPVDIEAFLRQLRKDGRSDSYLSSCRGMLHQIFHKAAANDLIHKNPVAFAEKKRTQTKPKRKEAFTAEEVQKLLRHLPDDRLGWSIRILLGTGMRTQELLALEPRHIEEDGSIIHVCQAINMVRGTVTVGSPKSQDSYRDIPVPSNLRSYAIALRHTDRQFIWEVGKKGSPCNPAYFRDIFKKAIGNVDGVRILTPHCCRHTYVSQMQALGVDLATIQSIVGHADIDMTQHYLHVQESIRQTAIQKFSEAFSSY